MQESDKKCTTHHYACDCREEKIKRLIECLDIFTNSDEDIYANCFYDDVLKAYKEVKKMYQDKIL